jgi:7-cyano-7-deazaguanine synthase
LARHYDVKQIEYDLSKIFETSNCSLLKQSSEEIPEESYSEQLKKQNGNPVSTYVPFRNGLFLSVAASVAVANDADVIYYGAHADDAAGNAYPDCSEMFNLCMGQAIFEGTGNKVDLEGPFVTSTKAEVVRTGLELNVPYELTWSCYEGGKEPCGKCGTCIDRAKAFEANGVKDPLISK